MSTRPPSPIDRIALTRDDGVGTLLLVRHGQQQWPDPETATTADWIDPPLSEQGESQAACVGQYLAGETVDAVYSSHLLRAHHTGLAIAGHHGLEVRVDPDLQEIAPFAHLPHDQRASDTLGETTMRGIRERFVRTQRWDAYPHTEPSDDFRRRIATAIEAILTAHPAEQVVIACHGGVINAYLADLLGLAPDMFFRPNHASVHRLRFDVERRVIATLNEIEHLRAADLLTV